MYSEAALTWFGTIATIFTFGSMIFSVIRTFRPSKQMQELDALLKETETLLSDAEEQGLLKHNSFLRHVKRRLSMLQDAVLLVRSEVHAASSSSIQDYTGVFTGLARKVSFVARGVKDLRATISRSSAKARLRLQEEARQAALETQSSEVLVDGYPTDGQQAPSLEFPNDDGTYLSDSSAASLYNVNSDATVINPLDGVESNDDAPPLRAIFPPAASIVAAVRTAPMRLLAEFRASRTPST